MTPLEELRNEMDVLGCHHPDEPVTYGTLKHWVTVIVAACVASEQEQKEFKAVVQLPPPLRPFLPDDVDEDELDELEKL